MPLFQQSVGAGEQEQSRIPEADKIGHESLLVGKYEARQHNQQFRGDNQQGKPREAQSAMDHGDKNAKRQHRKMHIEATKTGASEIRGHLLPEERRQKTLNAEERHDHIGKPNQQYGPESGAYDKGGDGVNNLAVRTQRPGFRGQHVTGRRGKTGNIQSHLPPSKSRPAIGYGGDPRPTAPISQIIVEQENKRRGDGPPR
ncbi:hypothetical protein MnTg02_02879 [bacterium MnTg02]|nr:hypothetical protein MnTg02_02879 [bacterium MnTg02]